MGDKDALIRAIIDKPQDDAPRLIFADWLDDYANMDPDHAIWAEYIRIQIALWRRDPDRQTGCGLIDVTNVNHGTDEVEREYELHHKINVMFSRMPWAAQCGAFYCRKGLPYKIHTTTFRQVYLRAKLFFLSQPIEEVSVMNVQPEYGYWSGGGPLHSGYAWLISNMDMAQEMSRQHHIPYRLAPFLPQDKLNERSGVRTFVFEKPEEAVQALELAIAAWGRSHVGLTASAENR
jgi:uncharacterized protein (TIGR02996 family)